MEEPIRALSEYFAQTISPNRDVINEAEKNLKTMSAQPGYGLTVLKLISLDTLPIEIRQAAAVNFKNHIKYRWVQQEGDVLSGASQPSISDQEKEQIKQLITNLMLSTPSLVRAQISEALSIISSHDFPAKWPTLLPELMEKLKGDPHTVSGVLQTANSIFERYRNQYMSDQLNKELEYLQNVVKPILDVFKGLRPQVEANQGNPDALKLLLTSAKYACSIFYSLNSPGLTEAFEQTLDAWMDEFHYYLSYSNPSLAESDSEKESVLDAVKAAVCENINLFMERNEEEFEKYLNQFASDVWQLLVAVTPKPGQDHLAMAAIRFLTIVTNSVHHKLFGSEGVLNQICENIIIPNLQLREEDEELFDMNFVEFIRRDTEGGDLDTRRRAACDLVKALTEKFPCEVTALFTRKVAEMLSSYAANPTVAWKAKDCATYLVMALTVRGKTAAQGATSTNTLVNIMDFFNQQILPDLQSASINDLPILKADALKFLIVFRSIIPKATSLQIFPNLVNLLASESNVVHSYAAIAIERLLSVKDGGKARFTPADLTSSLEPLLGQLFAAFAKPDSAENEYVMKCVMRVISFFGPQIAPVAPTCLQHIAQMLLAVCKNPTQPGFNHYLFESIAALVHNGVAADPAMIGRLEEMLFPAFQIVLQEDVQEFHPYVFQIFAQLIELRSAPLPDVYMNIFPPLLSPLFWERSGNVPALGRLLQAYISKASGQIVAGGHLQPLLGVFQKLNASKQYDQDGFKILSAIIEHVDASVYNPFLPQIWTLVFGRIQAARTPRYVHSFVLFVSLFTCKRGVQALQSSIDTLQPGLFINILQNVWVTAMGTYRGAYEQKLVSVATTHFLCDCPAIAANDDLWSALLEALMKLLEGKGQDESAEVEDEEDIMEYTGYSTAFARLHNAQTPEKDPLPEIPAPKAFLASSLAKVSANRPGRIRQLVANRMAQDMQQKLWGYCQIANVQIA